MKDLRTACDIDGVLADFNLAFRELLAKQTGKRPAVWPPQVWEWPDEYCTQDEVQRAWKEVDDSLGTWWLDLSVIGWPIAPLEQLATGDLYFLTARYGRGVKIAAESWLRHYCGVINPTVLIGLTPRDKGRVVRALDCSVVIDDKPENLVEIAEEAGIYRKGKEDREYFIFDQGWNKNFGRDPQAGESPVVEYWVRRVTSLNEVVQVVCG